MVPCVFCLENAALRDDQILVRGDALYVCAPRGQLVEGFFAVAPYACVGSLSQLPRAALAELDGLVATLGRFYAEAYGVASWLFYEQGRGGGGISVDPRDGFPIHAHLCALPIDVDLHAALAPRFRSIEIRGVADLPDAVPNSPYIYVECRDVRRQPRGCVYLPTTPETRAELESSRLKTIVAGLAGKPERAGWRDYPGDAEITAAVARFREWQASAALRDDRRGDVFREGGDGAGRIQANRLRHD